MRRAPCGCETNTQTSAANCGACGTVCSNANGTACNGVPWRNAGWGNCDNNAQGNGCETQLNTWLRLVRGGLQSGERDGELLDRAVSSRLQFRLGQLQRQRTTAARRPQHHQQLRGVRNDGSARTAARAAAAALMLELFGRLGRLQ